MTTQSPHDDDSPYGGDPSGAAPYGGTPTRADSRFRVDPPVDANYDPYRFGAPDHPIPPEYAPPGYRPPAPAAFGPPPGLPPQGHPPQPPQPYGYGSPPPYAAPQYHPYPAPRTGNGKAIASLVLGVLSIVFCFASFFDLVLIIPAIVFGSLALNEAKRTHTGRSVAIGGLVCAIVGAVFAITITVWLYPKVANCANDYPSNSSEYNTCIRNIVK